MSSNGITEEEFELLLKELGDGTEPIEEDISFDNLTESDFELLNSFYNPNRKTDYIDSFLVTMYELMIKNMDKLDFNTRKQICEQILKIEKEMRESTEGIDSTDIRILPKLTLRLKKYNEIHK